jgi:hypothetical protein
MIFCNLSQIFTEYRAESIMATPIQSLAAIDERRISGVIEVQELTVSQTNNKQKGQCYETDGQNS